MDPLKVNFRNITQDSYEKKDLSMEKCDYHSYVTLAKELPFGRVPLLKTLDPSPPGSTLSLWDTSIYPHVEIMILLIVA